jgi:hypothetical protein
MHEQCNLAMRQGFGPDRMTKEACTLLGNVGRERKNLQPEKLDAAAMAETTAKHSLGSRLGAKNSYKPRQCRLSTISKEGVTK